MAGDFLRLQCVRGALADVCRTIEELVAESGWQTVRDGSEPPASHFSRDVCVREEHGWIVVDAGEAHFEPWAARLAAALGTTGITMTSYSEEGALELARYDEARCTRTLALGREDTGRKRAPRARRRSTRLSLEFLADLVPSRARSGLRRGVLVSPDDSPDRAALEIAKLAGLPRPLSEDEWPDEAHFPDGEGGRILRFHHAPARRVGTRARARGARPKAAQVRFEETFHLRASRDAVGEAMKATLGIHDFVPVAANADAMTWAAGILRMFVHEEGGVLSFGELAIDDGRSVPTFKWAEILSRKLRVPVLSFWRQADGAEVTLSVGGREAGRVGLGALAERVSKTIDGSALAEFVPKKARVARLSIRVQSSLDATVRALGKRLGLAVPVLVGAVDGTELRFRRTGPVDHRQYREEQSAIDWAVRAPNIARLNPLLSHFADLTLDEALRECQRPAQRA